LYPGVSGTVTGTVTNAGVVSVTSTFAGQTATTITGTFVLTPATAQRDAMITGTLVEAVGASNYNMALFLDTS
jgi:hypothetical protein